MQVESCEFDTTPGIVELYGEISWFLCSEMIIIWPWSLRNDVHSFGGAFHLSMYPAACQPPASHQYTNNNSACLPVCLLFFTSYPGG